MPVKVRSRDLETATSRLKLPIDKRPYWCRIAPKRFLGYRRCKGPGTWTARTPEWERKLGLADDHEISDPSAAVFSFHEAVAEMRKLVRQEDGSETLAKPITLSEALDAYRDELVATGSDPYNAQRPKAHLPSGMLSMPLVLIKADELRRWRNSIKGNSAESINRTLTCLLAMVKLVAPDRLPIWKKGLEKLPAAQGARNIVLDDVVLLKLIGAAYRHDEQFGLFVHTQADSGARPSQTAALRCEDLILDPGAPKLMMPRSAKGGGRRRAEKRLQRFAVPITSALALRLKAASTGRAPDEPLLLRSDGTPWGLKSISPRYRGDFRKIVASIGLDPTETTLYCLRHSSVTRQLLRGVPVEIVARGHDTSHQMITKHYARHIVNFSDGVVRAALVPFTDNIPLAS